MKILGVKELAISPVKVIRFARFCDQRGYFTENFRRSDLENTFLRGLSFPQMNESFSRPSVVRGLHFQWNPYMGKLVRTIRGRMVDIFLDIRPGSPTFGRAAMYEMPAGLADGESEWIWVPPGFAHGNYFSEETQIEYLCSGEYSPDCEAGISPLAADIDWSLCDTKLKAEFDRLIEGGPLMADKDRHGFSLAGWTADPRSGNFALEKLK